MANKFQMSVQERLELDQKNRKAKGKHLPKASTSSVPTSTQEKNDAVPVPASEKGPTARETENTPPPTQEYTVSDSPINLPDMSEEEQLPEEAAENPATFLQSPAPSPLAGYLRMTPQRLAKNKTFYLDLDVIKALHQAAQKEGVADSKLANDILRTVLGLAD